MLAGGARPDAMAVAMASWSPHDDWASENGLFRTALSTCWAVQMARLKARRLGDSGALKALDGNDWRAHFTFLMGRPDLSHLPRWAQGSAGGAFTAPANIPLLLTAGANDCFLNAVLAADAAFRAVAPDTTHLMLGPWAHLGWNRSAGGARLGAGAERSVDREQLAFFDHYLKGLGPKPVAAVAYDAGTDAWGAVDPAGCMRRRRHTASRLGRSGRDLADRRSARASRRRWAGHLRA